MERRRPQRILIATMNKMPVERVKEVSERSQTLHYFLKLPMLVLVSAATWTSGASILLLKVADTVLQKGEFEQHWPVLLLVIAATLYTADTQL
mmetsp:Transcript_22543/g.27869  ORF Transcript_22543/g.27869 Transcript_22543/m.27869 type:complete len:93 (-) Transcript_22543:361-639(-)